MSLRGCGVIRAVRARQQYGFLRLFIRMPDAHPSGTNPAQTTPGKESAGRAFTSFRATSSRRPAGQAGAEADSFGSGDTGRIAGGVRQAFAAIDAGEVRRDEVNALLRVPSRALGAGAGSIAMLPRALAGDTGAFLVPAGPRAARPAWSAEFRGQYTGIKTIGADLRIDVQRSYTRPGVCSRRPGMS